MTYNWNNMVSITVPTGTNGWLYSGEVIINGVKVRFPVGVPTSVPEPAAVLLQKMIELEQEEDANTAKPQNHYVGDVTIPAGKTLTLEKGAKFVDNSGPSEVVILPETEIAVNEAQGFITTPLSATPTEGATAKVTYNGTEYLCPVAAAADEEGTGYLLGNIDNEVNGSGNPDAPFVVVLAPDGINGMNGVYGAVMPQDGATSVTLSIVQVDAASGGESAGGGTYDLIVDAATNTTEQKWGALVAAANAGKCVQMVLQTTNESGTLTVIGWLMAIATVNGAISEIYFYMPGLMIDKSARYSAKPGENDSIVIAEYDAD